MERTKEPEKVEEFEVNKKEAGEVRIFVAAALETIGEICTVDDGGEDRIKKKILVEGSVERGSMIDGADMNKISLQQPVEICVLARRMTESGVSVPLQVCAAQ